jgi:putative inorganic carbon (HCO3(-)) transporter
MPDPLKRHLPVSLQTTPARLVFLALAASVAASLLSIAASEILLFFAAVGAVTLLKPQPGRFSNLRPMLLALALFSAWTILAALVSPDALRGLTIAKKFFLFTILLLVPLVAGGAGRIAWIYRAVFVAAAASSAMGLIQYARNPERDLLHRISGFMGQWMTFSGLLMLALVALAAYFVCLDWRRQWWAVPAGITMFAAIYLSQTRSAMLGLIAGFFVVLLLRRPRATALLLTLVPALFFLSPSRIQERFRAGWHTQDPNTRNRIELAETSLRLIRDNPWFGVGPKNVSREAPRYRGSRDYPDWMYQHMHNNLLQIAAERGIPGLLLFLWFLIRLLWDAWRVFVRSSRDPASGETLMAATAALGCWAALMVSGFFEYNFGDSEVLMLFLFIMAAPYAFPFQGIEGNPAGAAVGAWKPAQTARESVSQP